MFPQLKVLVALATITSAHGFINSTDEIPKKNSLQAEKTGVPIEVHRKIYSYTRNSTAFKNFTFEDTVAFINELNEWKAPQDIRDTLPYYLWGYDYDNRPVWSQEVGSQDWRAIVEQGPGKIALVEKYFMQALIHVTKSLVAVDKLGEEVRSGVFIWDMDGFTMRQVTYLPSVAVGLQMARKWGDLPKEMVGLGIGINVNYATKVAFQIGRPLFGGFLERVELYGSNRNVWLPRLLKILPADIIPPKYGGNKKFKPVGAFG
ncbi:unnamed protein product [Allacma fusca]|uniref:CRAL-TRIO domain-containing protein n=1 Tax=Allacma fusca TaxID=39272 RepID=A0A8J2JGW5_9HEXA|nr:unnamed protein product [Allacma fusca]